MQGIDALDLPDERHSPVHQDEPASSLPEEVAAQLGQAVTAFQRSERLPGLAAGLVINDTLAWTACRGVADIETGRAVSTRTLFRIASISKTFAATAILALRDDGLLRLDDPIARYLPELRDAMDPFGRIEEVTIRRLLNHTSGLASAATEADGRPSDPWASQEPAAVLAESARLRVVDPPGAAFRYSNIGYGLLGLAIERIAGKPFGTVVAERVTGPAGMADTALEPAPDRMADLATGYDSPPFSGRPSRALRIESGWMPAAGGYWSSVEDLARWITLNLRPYASEPADAWPAAGGPSAQALIADTTLREMHRPTAVLDRTLGGAWGLGWYSQRVKDLVTFGHSGGLPGFTTRIALERESQTGAIVLANGSWDGTTLAMTLLEGAIPWVRDHAPWVSPDREPPVPEAWAGILGMYWGPEDRVAIEWRAGVLRAAHPDDGSARARTLVPDETPDHFTVRDEDGRWWGTVVLVREGGRVTGIELNGFPMARKG